MRISQKMVICLVLGGLAAVQASAGAFAQTAQQRAPGVPLAPNPSTIYRDESRGLGKPGVDTPPRKLDKRQERADERGAQRTLPMPKPVPSIIAPGTGQ